MGQQGVELGSGLVPRSRLLTSAAISSPSVEAASWCWPAYRCWVSSIALPDLDANANAVAIQTLKLENEGWERDLADVTELSEPSFTEPVDHRGCHQPGTSPSVWEQGARRHPIDRALLPSTPSLVLRPAGRSGRSRLGARNAALMVTGRASFGAQLASPVDCPACGERAWSLPSTPLTAVGGCLPKY